MNEEVKKKLASILYDAYRVTKYDYDGDSVHPCEYLNYKEIKEVAKEVGIDTSDW